MELISYLDECLQDNKFVRWPTSCMPLSVYIAPFRWYKSKNNEDSYHYKQMVMDAFNLWQRVSANKVSFKFVNNINESQINLDWRRIDRTSLGHCYYHIDNQSRLYSAEIQIGLSDGILHAAYEDKNEVFHTIIHEIGHSLGINHSPYQSDIMYVPHQYGQTSLSNKDINTLKWLYTFSYGVDVNEIISGYQLPVGHNIDHLIYSIENGQQPSNEKTEFKDFIIPVNGPNLVAQQQLLADINKFNLSIQNIGLSADIKNRWIHRGRSKT